MNMNPTLSLVDLLAWKANCMYVSDLHYLSKEKERDLKQSIEQIPVHAYDLRNWKDALTYLTGKANEEFDAEKMKQHLIKAAWR